MSGLFIVFLLTGSLRRTGVIKLVTEEPLLSVSFWQVWCGWSLSREWPGS